jgi:hypothetical protein
MAVIFEKYLQRWKLITYPVEPDNGFKGNI